ncbi:MAG: nucleoside transporter C-terminal domain-containing protein [Candidatus Electrothrix communis]|nr:nucleoside:proton symporter [Desulfobulbus sp. US4]WLE98367.1 MAG: nucleoside transporter C-terminal domain-containing protein [Candidatus Electrothrix communis]
MNINYVTRGLLGMTVLCLLAWLLSENKKQVRVKQACLGLLIQLALATLLLKIPFSKNLFLVLNKGVLLLQEATEAGTSFAFGYIGGGDLPFTESFPGAGFILAFQALPIILVMSALSALLTYWRILPALVRLFSRLFQKTMGIGGALAVGTAANIFLGMVESPLLIRPYLSRMTRSELFATMTCGMATIAGTVLILYVTILDKLLPDAAGHILAASIISVPAAITVARIMIPETENPTEGGMVPDQEVSSSMDAITKGTADGVGLFLNITAMLVVLVSLIHLVNLLLGLFPDFHGTPVTMQRCLGYVMAPVAWLMGIPWQEAVPAGSLLGIKTVLNEFLAYMELAKLPEQTLSPRSTVIMTYALCGFANFGSLGIMIGGMGTMAPERKNEIIALGIRSIIAGTLATCLTGATVGILLGE